MVNPALSKKQPNLKTLSEQEEPLNAASEQREACRACGLFRSCNDSFKYPTVPEHWTGRLVVVGEFEPAQRKLLRKIWRKAGWKDDDVALTPAVRCAPRGRVAPSMAQIRACRPFLRRVLDVLQPKFCIAAGSTALRALRNIGDGNVLKNRGKLIEVK